jgi:hypothetical protein
MAKLIAFFLAGTTLTRGVAAEDNDYGGTPPPYGTVKTCGTSLPFAPCFAGYCSMAGFY